MKTSDYAYAVANIRAIENNLLTQNDLELMLSARNLDETLRILSDKGFGRGEGDVEEILNRETETMWDTVYRVAPDPSLFDFLLYQNDFHNAKVAVKSLKSDRMHDELWMTPANVEPETMKRCVVEENFKQLPPFLADSAAQAARAIMQTGDGQLCDIILDRGYLSALLKRAGELNIPFFSEYVRLTVMHANLKMIKRMARMGKSADLMREALCDLPGMDKAAMIAAAVSGEQALDDYLMKSGYEYAAEAQDAAALEKVCDERMMAFVKTAKYVSLGAEPLLSYLFAKETEIKAVRIILSGKLNHVEPQSLKERLRELYV